MLEAREYERAAAYAARRQGLRTPDTIRRFQAVQLEPAPPPPPEGVDAQPAQPAILTYFGALLRRGEPLTAEESLELARPVVTQGQVKLLLGWIAGGQILPSEVRRRPLCGVLLADGRGGWLHGGYMADGRGCGPSFSQALADIVREKDVAAALQLYKTVGAAPAKLMQCHAELGLIDEVRSLPSGAPAHEL